MGGWMSDLAQWLVSATGLHLHYHHHQLTLKPRTAAVCREIAYKFAEHQSQSRYLTDWLQVATSTARACTLHTHVNLFSTIPISISTLLGGFVV